MADVLASAATPPEPRPPGGRSDGPRLGHRVTPWPEFVRTLDEADAESLEDVVAREQALSDFLDAEDRREAERDPDAGPAVRERRPGGGEARRQFDEDPVEDLRSSRGGYSAEVSDARSPHRRETFAERHAEALDCAVDRRRRGMAEAFAAGSEAVEAFRPALVSREPSPEYVARLRAQPGEPPAWLDGPNAPAARTVHLGYRIVEGDGSPHFVTDPQSGGQVIDPRVFQDRDQALSAAAAGQTVVATAYLVRGTAPSPEADAYRYAEPRLDQIAATGRIDPAAIAVVTGASTPIYGADPPYPSGQESSFLDKALDSHLALCYVDPGRSQQVEREWRRSADRLEARVSKASAPEDARAYVAALRDGQDESLPGWELARFASRAHAMLGRPVVEYPARETDPVRPAFDGPLEEALGDCYPDLHAAVRVLDPGSPLGHPAPTDDPGYERRLVAAVDDLQARAHEARKSVDPLDALAAVAVAQERSLRDPSPSPVAVADRHPPRPWEGEGSPGYQRRLDERLSNLVAAVDAGGVAVSFSDAIESARVVYRQAPATGPVPLGSAASSPPRASLELPSSYAAPGAVGASVADRARDGLPVIDGAKLGPSGRIDVLTSVALALPAALSDSPYPDTVAPAREALYRHVGAGGDVVAEREADHFAARMEARVTETRVWQLPRWEDAPSALAAPQLPAADSVLARGALAASAAVQVLADDIGRDAACAVELRERACERLQDDLVPALRDAGVPVVVDREGHGRSQRPARYEPDPRPAREQRGALQDAVVVPSVALDPGTSTSQLVAHQAVAFQAVSVALGQRGRLDRPEARRVASEIAGRSSAPAAARDTEAVVAQRFARTELRKVWPAQVLDSLDHGHAAAVRGKAGELYAKRASNFVERTVEARSDRLAASLAPSAAPAPSSPSRMAPVSLVRPPAPARPSATQADSSRPASR